MTREEYAESLLGPDNDLERIKLDIAERGMPAISVPPELGRLLTLLVKTAGAKRVLEIGALGGYSGVCLARGLAPGGVLLSLELNPDFAAVAQANVAASGFGGVVEYRVGPAAETLEQLAAQGDHFDFFFIDADKPNYPVYLEYALRLSLPGAWIVADNVLLGGRVMDPDNHDPGPEAVRTFTNVLFSNPRLEPVILPVRDGFALARVRA